MKENLGGARSARARGMPNLHALYINNKAGGLIYHRVHARYLATAATRAHRLMQDCP